MKRAALVPFIALTIARDAWATGVTETPDNGSEQMARGGAWVARASDPLATAFNPAGLAGQALKITVQTNINFHHTCFTRLKAAADTSSDPLAGPDGRFPRVCNDIEPSLNPQVAFNYPITDRLSAGIALLGPATTTKNWPEFINDATGTPRAAPQRYLLTEQSGLILFPTLGAGYEVVPNLRLGASFGWGLAKVKTTAATVALNNAGLSPDNDVKATLQARDWFVPRLSAGVLWSLTPEVDVGGFYQWTDSIKATGDVGTATSYYTTANARGNDVGVGYGDTYFSDCGTGRAQDAGKCGSGDNGKVTIPVPMEAKVGVRYHQPRGGEIRGKGFRRDPLANDRFDAELNLTWANNSAIENLEVSFPSDRGGGGRLPVAGINSTIPPDADQPKMYRDVFGVRVGGDFNILPDQLALRAGAYFESAALRPQYQNIDFAASQRFGLSVGATYRVRLSKDENVTSALEIMVGYGHTFFADQIQDDRNAKGVAAVAGTPCPEGSTVTGPGRCSDGTPRYRTKWPVNLGTITNTLNVINVGVAYRF